MFLQVAQRCKDLGINALHVKIRATVSRVNIEFWAGANNNNRVVTEPRPPVPAPSPLSVPWPVAVCELAALRMLPPHPPTAPAERVVVAVVVCDRAISNHLSRIDLPFVWVWLWLGHFYRRSRENCAVSGTYGLELVLVSVALTLTRRTACISMKRQHAWSLLPLGV